MKVYLLYGNNGELYDDYYEWVEGVYTTREKARERKKELDKKAEKDHKKEPFYGKRTYWIKEYEVIE